jgi:hypothetical protein
MKKGIKPKNGRRYWTWERQRKNTATDLSWMKNFCGRNFVSLILSKENKLKIV